MPAMTCHLQSILQRASYPRLLKSQTIGYQIAAQENHSSHELACAWLTFKSQPKEMLT